MDDLASKEGLLVSSLCMNTEDTNLADNAPDVDKCSYPNKTVSIFLRIKPLDHSEKAMKSTMSIEDENTVICKSPNKEKKHGQLVSECARYKFTHIYDESIGQADFFMDCVYPQIRNSLAKEGSLLLFTYGTTNAGKTFTVQGNAQNPGILPRLLDLVFRVIEDRHDKTFEYKPEKVDSVKRLSSLEVQAEIDLRKRIFGTTKKQNDLYSVNKENTYVSNKFPEIKDFISLMAGNSCYSVWVSFFEIYNEAIYDLLEEPNKITKNRTRLKLGYDERKNAYIKGLIQVCVTCPEEANKVLTVGRKNLSFASTKMNATSSRSHCTFIIRLLKHENVPVPKFATVMSISLCDLAGTERQNKACNVGERLWESQNINLSLHTLNRCFSMLRENLINQTNHIVPYRDSKLTQLFQRALSGQQEERVMMIVNVNPSPLLYHETQQVLKSSAEATFLFKEQIPISSMKRNEIINRRSTTCANTVLSESSCTAIRKIVAKKQIRGILKDPNQETRVAPDLNNRHITVMKNDYLYSKERRKEHKNEIQSGLTYMKKVVWPKIYQRTVIQGYRFPLDISRLKRMLCKAKRENIKMENEIREDYIKRCIEVIDDDTDTWSNIYATKIATVDESIEERLNKQRSEYKKQIESAVCELRKDELFLECENMIENVYEFEIKSDWFMDIDKFTNDLQHEVEKAKIESELLEKTLDEKAVAFSETVTNNERKLCKYESEIEKAATREKYFKTIIEGISLRVEPDSRNSAPGNLVSVNEMLVKELRQEKRYMETIIAKKMKKIEELKKVNGLKTRLRHQTRYNHSDENKKPFLTLLDERVAAALKKREKSTINKDDSGVLRDLNKVDTAFRKEQCV